MPMCVDDYGYGATSSSQLGRSAKANKTASSSSSAHSSAPSSEEDESTFGILVADEVSEKDQHNMNTTPTICHGLISVIGRRRSMEDAVTAIPNLVRIMRDNDYNNNNNQHVEESRFDFFAVYDGHGGHRVANKCKERLHQLVAEEIKRARASQGELNWESVMTTSFASMDAEVANSDELTGIGEEGGSRSAAKSVGSTALVVVIGKEEIVVANCGDCRVVLFHGGAALPLSHDHKPERPDEQERVEAAGGHVVTRDCSRVLGVLATSRAIGDKYLKPYVISEPEITVYNRNSSDDFLVIATDGLWDVLSNEAACDLVRKCFRGQVSKKVLDGVNGNCSAAAATMLAELAIARGSRDNISVIVVQLQRSNSTSLT